MRHFVLAGLLACALPAAAQLPPSKALSQSELPQVGAEIARLEKILAATPDKAALTYQIARTWASAGQWPEAISWLRKVAAANSGHDPSNDPRFASIRSSREFTAILEAIQSATPPVINSKPAFQVNENDLVPESLAYDPESRTFYFGSLTKGKVVRCSAEGACRDFVSGLGVVIGLKVRSGTLWLANNSETESALLAYELSTGRLKGTYRVAGPGHMLNDVDVAPGGDAYVTDTRAGAVWRLPCGAKQLTRLPGRFAFANGLTLTPDGKLLYVSTWPEGLVVVDLPDGPAKPLVRPEDVSLSGIDSLYSYGGSLIAVQNAFMSPRVVRLSVTDDRRTITHLEILERRHPLYDGVTTGVLVEDSFFYMANMQMDRKTGFQPINILKLELGTGAPRNRADSKARH